MKPWLASLHAYRGGPELDGETCEFRTKAEALDWGRKAAALRRCPEAVDRMPHAVHEVHRSLKYWR